MKIPLREYWNLFKTYLKPHWPKVVLLGVLLACSVGLQLVNPQILRAFIDLATGGGAAERLTMLALFFIGAAIVQQALAVAATYVSQLVGWAATNGLRTDLAAHCLRLDMTFHKARRPGEIIERIDGDVTALFQFFSKLVLNVLNNVVLLIGVLTLLFREDWRIGLGLTSFVAVTVVVLLKVQNVSVPHWVSLREVVAQFFGFLGEQIASTEDVRANGATGHVMHRFYEFLRKWYPRKRRASILMYSMWMISLGLFALGHALAFGLGGYLWSRGIITIGTVYLVFHYTELLNRPLEQIRQQLESLQKAGASIARVKELLQIESQLRDGEGSALSAGALGVELDQVSFYYEIDLAVLKNISLQIAPGTVLGLLGRTGSGKTTLARLMVRFYDPTQGEIRFNGQPLRSLSLGDLRERVAYVTQEVQLFHGTIRDNLTFFDEEMRDDEIMQALEEIGLGEWFRTLPAGLNTMLDAEGGGLSAGEAQLLAFVRVFLRDPGLVILDEASSRLDPLTERLIEGAVQKLLEGRTAIIIAHRLGTVQRADEILILDEGGILEYGKRVELASDPDSRFYHLLQTGLEEVLA